jgi:phage terminase large subunit-like protein
VAKLTPPEWLAPEDRALWDAMGEATPRFTTWPTPGAPSELDANRMVARALGTPLMPAQEWTIRIATEKRRGSRRYRYRQGLISKPRQSGKTTEVRTILTTRGILYRGRRAFYTAQTGKDATERWKDLVKQLTEGPLRDHVVKRMAIGSQAVTFPNSSSIAPFAPTPKSLHGYTPHDVVCDEIFAFDDAQGQALEGAIGPAQITLEDAQTLYLSTMGTKDSTFLHAKVDAGRLATLDPEALTFYVEWSLEDGLDPYDPANWTFHPALGHTVSLDDLKAMADPDVTSRGEWLRAYMNRRTTTSESVIPAEVWADLAAEQTPPASTRDLCLAYEVALDRSRAAVLAGWTDPRSGVPSVRVVWSGGPADLASIVLKLRAELRPRAVGADDAGPTRDTTEAIRQADAHAGEELEILSPRDFALASDNLKDRALKGTLSHDGHPYLAESVENATQRAMGQGWAWDRVKSRGPIPELIAATVALRLVERAPAPAPQPMVWVAE